MKCGPYEIVDRIGSGGMSEVYRARHRDADPRSRPVVLKRLLPDAADDPELAILFYEEAQISTRLVHPNIVRVLAYHEDEEDTFIVMEWIDGVRLSKLIRDAEAAGGIPPAAAATIVARMLAGLHHAHGATGDDGERLDVVHRDVSPKNVMVGYAGEVKLIDFGIAKTRTQLSLTETGLVRGTAGNLSPEQCLKRPLDARSDVFSTGICLYELLTGRRLYLRANDYETMLAIVHDPVPSARDVAPSVPPELDAVAQRALAKRPEARYPTAAAMRADLEAWLARASTPAAPVRALMARLYPDRAPAPPRALSPLAWLALVVTLFVLVSGVTYLVARLR